jgi:hypothetical protein
MESFLYAAAAIVALAAALKAAFYLIAKLRQTGKLMEALFELTREDGWPNGAESLQASHRDLFDKVSGIETSIKELQTAVEQVLTDR